MAAARPSQVLFEAETGLLVRPESAGATTIQPKPINMTIAPSFVSIRALWTLLPARMPKQLMAVRTPRVRAATACSGIARPVSSWK